jgi:L-lactate dehydrogenase complex protein LldG
MMASLAKEHANDARAAIMKSIREHLAKSPAVSPEDEGRAQNSALATNGDDELQAAASEGVLVAKFRAALEAVGGHCFLARDSAETSSMLTKIVRGLPVANRRIAISDIPEIQSVIGDLKDEIGELAVNPPRNDLFNFDVGVTTAQLAIAETGTLVLESDRERHRLVSLVPPIHIALVKAENIVPTLGDAFSVVRRDAELSRAITFITGPSRTADIELTLSIGVHGPKDLYVIVQEETKAG